MGNKYFEKDIDKFFIGWIKIDTWYTIHFDDMERFYKFVHSVVQFSKENYTDEDIKENIKRAVKDYHSGFDNDYLNKTIRNFVSIAGHCIDFSKVKI